MPRAKLEAKEEPAVAAGGSVKLEEAAEEPAAAAATKPATAAKSSFGGNTFFPGKNKGSSPYGKGWEEGFPGKGKDSFNKGKSKGWEEGFSEGLKLAKTFLFQDFRKLAGFRRGLESLEDEMEEQLQQLHK